MLSQKDLHERVLYPVVRVKTNKAGGSGTVIYSELNPESDEEEYITLVLTNHHVVDDAITVKTGWDSLLLKDRKKEFCELVDVEIFDYVFLSQVNSSNQHKADIIAHDKHQDIAVLRLRSPKKMSYVAKLYPKDEERKIKLFTPVQTVGASLLHDPFANPGFITYLSEMIDKELFWMTNANSIFGNSGGAVYLTETGEFIGIPARITGIQLGFGLDIITFMGFFVPIPRIYKFFEEQELKFIYDPKDTYAAAMRRREKKQKEALLMLAKEAASEESEDEEKFTFPQTEYYYNTRTF